MSILMHEPIPVTSEIQMQQSLTQNEPLREGNYSKRDRRDSASAFPYRKHNPNRISQSNIIPYNSVQNTENTLKRNSTEILPAASKRNSIPFFKLSLEDHIQQTNLNGNMGISQVTSEPIQQQQPQLFKNNNNQIQQLQTTTLIHSNATLPERSFSLSGFHHTQNNLFNAIENPRIKSIPSDELLHRRHSAYHGNEISNITFNNQQHILENKMSGQYPNHSFHFQLNHNENNTVFLQHLQQSQQFFSQQQSSFFTQNLLQHYANPPSFHNFAANITHIPNQYYAAGPVVFHGLPIPSNQQFSIGGIVGTANNVIPGTTAIGYSSFVQNPTSPFDSASQELINRKEWFESLLRLAHQKYNSQEFSGALSILQDLYNLNQHHLPTLLLLGCTCYSLGLHNMSIFYNNLILNIDSNFAEAYSNLGTTHRALSNQNLSQQLAECRNINLPPNLIGKSNIECSEYYYRMAIQIRPKYWDASINLAGLLSSQSRHKEAIDVYEAIESLVDDLSEQEKIFDLDKGNKSDSEVVSVIMELEKRRSLLHYANNAGNSVVFTTERRRDLYFAKGNLLYAMNNIQAAKKEYFKGLIAVGLDIGSVFANSIHGTLPISSVTPQLALAINQKNLNTPSNDPLYHPTTSSILQTLAKIFQDFNLPALAVSLYYLSLSIFPTANTCNNLGILLASHRLQESIQWYECGLALDPQHVHLYTNLGSALKDRGQINEGISCYQQAIAIQPDFFIALANLANVYRDLGRVEEAVDLYRRALQIKPDFVEAFCNYVNSLLFICSWENRDQNLQKIKEVVEKQLKDGIAIYPNAVPTVLPFHTFTYSSLSSWMVREISRRNADRVTWNVKSSDWFPGFPKKPREVLLDYNGDVSSVPKNVFENSLHYPFPYDVSTEPTEFIHVGYVSSDFNNHPLAHLMQSVFGFHDRSKFRVFCYSLSPTDNSTYREKIKEESDVFVDVSSWGLKEIVERISLIDKIHVLCNLNGYTKGGRNEIFAARAAPIQMAFMGFAGTMGAGNIYDPENNGPNQGVAISKDGKDRSYFEALESRWIDYFVVDEVSCPRKLVCGEPLSDEEVLFENENQQFISPQGRAGLISNLDDRNRVYTERLIYMPESYFVNDHAQGFREQEDTEVTRLIKAVYHSEDQPGNLKSSDIWPDEAYLSNAERLLWRTEEIRRLKMRNEVFPNIREDTVIFANFNQLYKVDPDIFYTWMNILKRVPNSILWLLRFPPAGEKNLRKLAEEYAGVEVAKRLIFTAVASKHIHIHRGRVADVFLDTPECNAHTTAADILWSGTPIITYPKYEFKMCSRVAASICYATGSWDQRDSRNFKARMQPGGLNLPLERLREKTLLGHHMVVNSYSEYEQRAVSFGLGIKWGWKRIGSRNDNGRPFSDPVSNPLKSDFQNHPVPFYPNTQSPLFIYVPSGTAVDLRRTLFLNRDKFPLFDTKRWVYNLEKGMKLAVKKFYKDWKEFKTFNKNEFLSLPTKVDESGSFAQSKCLWIKDITDEDTT
ncbi:hypothetical protein HDU92_005964 [Lobulomyces angularis]|nr:hypothetical protein HDU92_005964 [Lobulomyces angularis]